MYADERREMFLASKTVGTGIVFALLTTGMLALSLTSPAAGSDLKQEAPAHVHTNDVKRLQQALQDRGYYRGKIDGVIGLRTRASIRGFQKAEELPVTGEIDLRTAKKVGVAVQDIVEYREQMGPQKNKPWAGTKSATAVRRTRNTLTKVVPSAASAEIGQEYREDRLHSQNEKQPQ
jgi:peptidoglycan hydrolase-like protein with peptidoglycan-binding domain